MTEPQLTILDIIPIVSQSIDNQCRNNSVYHYTDLNAFINIFSNREFWISNINYMNDSEEFSNGLQICIKVLEEYISKDTFELKKQFASILGIIRLRKIPELMGIDTNNLFSISFCHHGDLLTQWNCYGINGVAIGFRNNNTDIDTGIALVPKNLYQEELKKYTSPDQMIPKNERLFYLKNVIYDDTEKEKVFRALFDHIAKEEEKIKGVIDIFQSNIINSIYYFCAYMKNQCFSHEQEARIIFPRNQNVEVSYRTRGNAILPYIKYKILNLNCRPHKLFPVSDIVLCPNPNIDYTMKSVKYFLQTQGYEYLVDKVRASEIPFRS